ncbi:MAG: LptF/LptG family permease, partial [Elusimicrobiaceae bacterium]|nr:LptF/LptG family permease [Elusimicrobiaceae bacterium]
VRQIVWPLIAFSVLIMGLLLWVNNWVSPTGFAKFQNSQHMMAESITRLRLEPKTFLNIGDWRLYSEAVDNQRGRLEDVHLFRSPAGGAIRDSVRVSAPAGRYRVYPGKGFELTLKNGEFQRVDPKDPRRVVLAKFQSYRVFIPFGVPFKKRTDISLTEMATPDIIAAALYSGSLVPIRRAEYKIEAATRMAVALAPVIFFYLSCPFGVSLSRTGRAMGMVLSIVILFLFYGLMAVGISLGKKLLWLAWWGPFLPDAAGLFLAGWLWRRRLR